MEDHKTRDIIVVIGSGRSGTSLTMQVLNTLGMSISEQLIAEPISNPLGHIEDANVFQIHQYLMQAFFIGQNLLLPKNFMQSSLAFEAKEALKKIVLKNIEKTHTVWGVKDPRIALFFPLWIQIFQELKLTPKYILCVRNPNHVVASTQKYYNWDLGDSELFWLVRNIYSLFYTRANVFIAHYEDWLTKPQEMADNLANFTGLVRFFPNGISPDTSSCVRSDLNRSIDNSHTIQNILISKLYSKLLTCRQANFDQKGLLQVTEECFAYINACRSWSDNAITKNIHIKKLHDELKTLKNS